MIVTDVLTRDFTGNELPEVEEMLDELRDSIGTPTEDRAKSRSRRKEPWMGRER